MHKRNYCALSLGDDGWTAASRKLIRYGTSRSLNNLIPSTWHPLGLVLPGETDELVLQQSNIVPVCCAHGPRDIFSTLTQPLAQPG